jgi:hypothetical protein
MVFTTYLITFKLIKMLDWYIKNIFFTNVAHIFNTKLVTFENMLDKHWLHQNYLLWLCLQPNVCGGHFTYIKIVASLKDGTLWQQNQKNSVGRVQIYKD